MYESFKPISKTCGLVNLTALFLYLELFHSSDKEKYPLTQKIEELVKQILELRKNGKTGDAEFLESKIDEMVEKLYGVE